jgi:hypothetical protein
MALQPFVKPWPPFQFLNFYTVGRSLGRGISSSQVGYLHTRQQGTPNKRIYIHASSVIRTHDPSDRPGEDSSCLTPRGHCHRPFRQILGHYLKIDHCLHYQQKAYHILLKCCDGEVESLKLLNFNLLQQQMIVR